MRLASFITIWALVAPGLARGELTVVEQDSDQGKLTTYKLTVTPAAEPVPAFKYRFTLREPDYRPGNAANHYMRAFPEGGIEANWKRLEKDYGEEEVYTWYDIATPLSKIPLEKAHTAAATFSGTINSFVVPASQRIDCDWGHSIVAETEGPELFSFLLPEIQSLRSMSRALMLVTRMAIADGDYARAIDLLRMNYRLGENVAKSPFLVSGLVGLAISGLGNAEVIELIGSKDSPNLYWALSELPRPPVSLRTALRYELAMDSRVFPVLHEAETARHTPEEWGRLLAKSLQDWGPLANGPSLDPTAAQAGMAGLALVVYPDAKKRLIESGMDAAAVGAMPVGQVVAIDTLHEFQRLANDYEKWQYVPYTEGKRRYKEPAFALGEGTLSRGLGGMLASLLLPALESVRAAEMRMQWQMDAMRVVEALRMHAAETGKLPASLDEVKVVPMPNNPVTEKPYQYHLDGETAVVELPFADGFANVAYQFEITLAK